MLTSEHTAKEIEQKAKKVMGMLKHGVKFTPTQPNVMALLEKLQQRNFDAEECMESGSVYNEL